MNCNDGRLNKKICKPYFFLILNIFKNYNKFNTSNIHIVILAKHLNIYLFITINIVVNIFSYIHEKRIELRKEKQIRVNCVCTPFT